METLIISPEEVQTKSYSLSGGDFFKKNPEKVLAEAYEASGKFGPTINYRPKKGVDPIDALKDINVPEFSVVGVLEGSAGKTIVADNADNPLTPDQEVEVDKVIADAQPEIVKTRSAKTKSLMEWEKPDEDNLQSFSKVLNDYNLNVLQPKAKKTDPDVYEQYMTMEEIKVFLWYMYKEGRAFKGEWLNVFDPYKMKDGDEAMLIKSWSKAHLIFYERGKWIPKVLYLSGNLYEKKGRFDTEKESIAQAFGQDVADGQAEVINNAYQGIYESRLRLDNPKIEERLKIKPFSDFAKKIMIGSWKIDGETEAIKPFVLMTSKKQVNYGDINWGSANMSPHKYTSGSKSYDELSLADAFRYWLKHEYRGAIGHDFNWADIFSFYLDKSNKPGMDKAVLAKKRSQAREAGDKIFGIFMAEVITEHDRKKIETAWNLTFNATAPINTNKIPIGLAMAKTYPKEQLFDIRTEKREAMVFHLLAGSSVNAFQVGLGKSISASLVIGMALDAGHCERPFLVLPNQVYNQFYKELKGVLPHRKIYDLYNLSKDYMDQLMDENDKIMKVEAGSISMVTYEGFQKIGFNSDTKIKMKSQLKEAISMLQSSDAGTKTGETKIVKEDDKFDGLIGKALAKTIVDIEDLGFDFVTFDEAHALKKIFSQVKARAAEEGSRGKKMYEISAGKPSSTGIKGYFLCSYIQTLGNNNGRNVLLLTATPFTNSPLEVYSMLSLVAYQKMRKMNLANINDFFDNFCHMSDELVINSKLKPQRKQVFKGFDNLIGLQSLIFKYMLYREQDKNKPSKRPEKYVLPYKGKPDSNGNLVPAPDSDVVDTILPLSNQQKDMMLEVIEYVEGKISKESLEARASEVEEDDRTIDDIIDELAEENPEWTKAEVKKEAKEIFTANNEDTNDVDENNLGDKEKAGVRTLVGVNLARSLALSPYLYKFSGLPRPTAKQYIETSPKLKYIMDCIDGVKKWTEKNGIEGEQVSGQVIYMDRGKKYFNLIKEYLITELGYKDHEIGIIMSGQGKGGGEHKEAVKNGFNGEKWNEATKNFDKISEDERIKIIIGTGSIKEGMNLQSRSTILYNAFIDWNPTDGIQLSGRIWRQGNPYLNIRIVIPQMSDSMDIFMFQKLEEKTSRINSIWQPTGSNELAIDEIDAGEQKEALITDPRVIAELRTERQIAEMEEDITLIESNIDTAKNIKEFVVLRNEFEKELVKVIEIISPDKSSSSIDVMVKTFEAAYTEGKIKYTYPTGSVVDISIPELLKPHKYNHDFKFLNYGELFKPYDYANMKAAVANIKRAKTSFLDRYEIAADPDALDFYVETEEGNATKVREEKKRLKSAEYLNEKADEIQQERKKNKIVFASVEDRVQEFKKLNRFLGEMRRPLVFTDEVEVCPPMTADGKRDISPAAIKMLEACIADLSSTKSMHTDKEGVYTPERLKLHRRIKGKMRERAECIIGGEQPIAVLMGGPPGSGKSTFLRKYAPFLTKDRIFKIDADEIRAELPEYKGWNSSATHKETQDIYLGLLDDIAKGKPCKYDILWDGTMNRVQNYLPLISKLRKLNYKIYIIYLKVDGNVSIERALKRYQNPDGDGRYVPMEVIREAHKTGTGGFNALKDKADGYMFVDGVTSTIIDKHGDDILSGRGYFDKESDGKETKIKRAKLKVKLQSQRLRILSLDKEESSYVKSLKERRYSNYISAESKNKKGVFLDLEIRNLIGVGRSGQTISMYDNYVSIEYVKGKKCINVTVSPKSKLSSVLNDKFNFESPKEKTLNIEITDESWDKIENAKKNFTKEEESFLADMNEITSKMPVKYFMYDFFDMGDYTVNNEHSINVFRKGLEEENSEKVLVKSYNLWNKSLDGYEKEWKNDLTRAGGDSGDASVEIDEKLAKKWIGIHEKVSKEKGEQSKIKVEKAEKKKEEEEKRRSKCFEKAKETGEKVVLYSYFLSGNDIPRNLRDEDSDMGTLYVYAMPSGKTEEEFSHAY